MLLKKGECQHKMKYVFVPISNCISFVNSFLPSLPVKEEVCVWVLSVLPMAGCRHIHPFLALQPGNGRTKRTEVFVNIFPIVFLKRALLTQEYWVEPKKARDSTS